MKKVFIDGGAHRGESIDNFRRLYSDYAEYEIHSFEPNNDMWSLLEEKGVILHRAGLWDEDGKFNFYTGRFSEGSTFLEKKVSGKVDYNHPVEVETVRLSKWITDSFDKDDFIILKLDIEGAEYRVIPDLIETGAYKFINEWYGELHSTGSTGRIRSLDDDTRTNLVGLLDEYNIQLKDWFNNKNNL